MTYRIYKRMCQIGNQTLTYTSKLERQIWVTISIGIHWDHECLGGHHESRQIKKNGPSRMVIWYKKWKQKNIESVTEKDK